LNVGARSKFYTKADVSTMVKKEEQNQKKGGSQRNCRDGLHN